MTERISSRQFHVLPGPVTLRHLTRLSQAVDAGGRRAARCRLKRGTRARTAPSGLRRASWRRSAAKLARSSLERISKSRIPGCARDRCGSNSVASGLHV